MRFHPVRRAALLAGVALAAVTVTAPAAHAQPGLPPIGAEIPMSMLAINTPMHLGDDLVTVDFRGGIKQRVEVNPDDPFRSVRLRTVGFRVTAELPGGGTLTLEQTDVDVDASSSLRLVQPFPPRYEHHIVVPVTLTIDRSDADPIVLTSTNPLHLIGQITQFPPRGEVYQLQQPVQFVSPDDPDTTAAILEKMPTKIGGL